MAIQTSPNSKPGSLFFFDARSCKEWLKAIPLTSIAQAQQKLLDALRFLNRSTDFEAIERLTCMELLRDKVAFLLGEQRARYADKVLPLSNSDLAAWAISNNLIAEMEAGYRRCYQDAQNEDAPLGAHAALIVQRTIRYIGLGMLMAGFIYRRFDSAIWMRLHLQWIEAESRGLTKTRVKDSIGAIDGYSSVEQAYVAVLLGQLANIYELRSREIDFVDAIMKRFSHKVTLSRDVVPNAQDMMLAVDLLSNAGAQFHLPAAMTDNVLVLDVSDISKSLRRRAKKLLAGETPENLDLPQGWGVTEAHTQVSRLHKYWCEGAPTHGIGTVPTEPEATVAFGIAETHFFLSGDLFEQPDVKRELSRAEMNDIAMFGRVSESTIRTRYAEFNYGAETWPVLEEGRGQLRLARPANSTRGVAIGNLVGIKVGKSGEFYLAVIRELLEDTPSHFMVTLGMLPGKPEATSVRSTDNKSRSATYVQGFRLPPMEGVKVAESLIIPANLVHKGRGIDIFHQGHGSPKQVTLIEFIERGGDFDRVAIAG